MIQERQPDKKEAQQGRDVISQQLRKIDHNSSWK